MISIFTRPSYIGNRHPRHTTESVLIRLSSRIRGEEIAEYLGGKLNPKERDGVCIYVKPVSLSRVKDGDWLDYLDSGEEILEALKLRPKIKVIAASELIYEYLKENLTNEVVFIPSHHINSERIKRERNEVTTGGYIGSPSPQATREYHNIGVKLKEIGFDFKTCFNFKTRQDAIDLYKSIDFFIISDNWQEDGYSHRKVPTKIINAASFGIPSIAFPLKGYKEIEEYYIRANSMEEMLAEVVKFKDKDYYDEWSNKVLEIAEPYHISNIAKMYEKLE